MLQFAIFWLTTRKLETLPAAEARGGLPGHQGSVSLREAWPTKPTGRLRNQRRNAAQLSTETDDRAGWERGAVRGDQFTTPDRSPRARSNGDTRPLKGKGARKENFPGAGEGIQRPAGGAGLLKAGAGGRTGRSRRWAGCWSRRRWRRTRRCCWWSSSPAGWRGWWSSTRCSRCRGCRRHP